MRAERGILVLLAVTAVACGRPQDQRTDSLDPAGAMKKLEEMPIPLKAQLDSGSAAFRAKDVESALRHYTAATEIDDGVPAAWFGVYMAQKALGHVKEALAALERVQSLAPGATLVEPVGGTTS